MIEGTIDEDQKIREGWFNIRFQLFMVYKPPQWSSG